MAERRGQSHVILEDGMAERGRILKSFPVSVSSLT